MRSVFLEFALVILVAAGLFGIAVYAGVRRGRQLLELDRRGTRVTGTIVDKRTVQRQSGAAFQIVYEYPAIAGILRGSSFVSAEQFAAIRADGPIELRYLSDNPKVVAPVFVIEQAVRAAAETEARRRRP